MHRSAFRAYCAVLVTAMALGLINCTNRAATAQAQIPPATQNERLKERNKLDQQANTLRAQGKFTEALQAAAGMLAMEREVLGETSDDAIGSVKLIAQLQHDRGDWVEARKSWSEVLALLTKKLDNDDWQVVDARWSVTNAESLAKLDEKTRRKLVGADEREQRASELYSRSQFAEAVRIEREVVAIRKELQGRKPSISHQA